MYALGHVPLRRVINSSIRTGRSFTSSSGSSTWSKVTSDSTRLATLARTHRACRVVPARRGAAMQPVASKFQRVGSIVCNTYPLCASWRGCVFRTGVAELLPSHAEGGRGKVWKRRGRLGEEKQGGSSLVSSIRVRVPERAREESVSRWRRWGSGGGGGEEEKGRREESRRGVGIRRERDRLATPLFSSLQGGEFCNLEDAVA